MIAPISKKQHTTEFEAGFDRIFSELTCLARSKGITGCCAAGGTCNSEDAEDFAQECLIEYWNRAPLE